VGANYEESQAGSSKADFVNKVNIALKEMRETSYWLRIIRKVFKIDPGNVSELESLVSESDELKKILGSITANARKH